MYFGWRINFAPFVDARGQAIHSRHGMVGVALAAEIGVEVCHVRLHYLFDKLSRCHVLAPWLLGPQSLINSNLTVADRRSSTLRVVIQACSSRSRSSCKVRPSGQSGSYSMVTRAFTALPIAECTLEPYN